MGERGIAGEDPTVPGKPRPTVRIGCNDSEWTKGNFLSNPRTRVNGLVKGPKPGVL